jgi:hypothetical protein
MWSAILFSALAVAATVTAAWDKLTSDKIRLLIIGVITVLTAMLSQAAELWDKHAKLVELEQQILKSNDANVLLYSQLAEIDEASGGAVDPSTGIAYIVDDEEAAVFAMKYDAAARAYVRRDSDPIPLVDRRECETRFTRANDEDKAKDELRAKDKQSADCSKTLDKNEVTDLEGAAFHGGHLYLISTLGNSNQGVREERREQVLELTLAGEVLNTSSRLRPIIERYFHDGLPCSEDTVESLRDGIKEQVMRVEGLAIDKNGWVYVGFRAPLVRNTHALVLRTRLEELFQSEPKFESFLLPLAGRDDEYYGITSLDYDAEANRLIVMGNHAQRNRLLPPRIWTWTPTSTCTKMQQVEPLQGHIFSEFGAIVSRPAKPEVVLALAPDLLHIFFDAEGSGGQLSLARRGNQLTQLREPRLTYTSR